MEISMDNSELSSQHGTLIVQGNPPLGTFKEPQVRTITFTDGTRKAVIDLTGPAVTYSGDLPVDESAKIFCDAVYGELRRKD